MDSTLVIWIGLDERGGNGCRSVAAGGETAALGEFGTGRFEGREATVLPGLGAIAVAATTEGAMDCIAGQLALAAEFWPGRPMDLTSP
jgi:hypothetical protein